MAWWSFSFLFDMFASRALAAVARQFTRPIAFTRAPVSALFRQQRSYASEAKASELKVNNYVEYQGKIWNVHSITRSAQGAQRSVLIMVEMKEYKTGRKDLIRFDQDDAINGAFSPSSS
jgi:hypothetical protein